MEVVAQGPEAPRIGATANLQSLERIPRAVRALLTSRVPVHPCQGDRFNDKDDQTGNQNDAITAPLRLFSA